MDRWLYSRSSRNFQKSKSPYFLANEKMWVSAEEYQEDPEVQPSDVYIANLDYPS